jgi:hypothetical protein
MATILFVSGHMDLEQAEFDEFYKPELKRNITARPDCLFVIGNARGADTMVLHYLLDDCKINPNRITVYIHSNYPKKIISEQKRLALLGVSTVVGFKTSDDRDAAMTAASSMDIAWVRPKEKAKEKLGSKYNENHVTGTEKNILRRRNNK